MTDEDGRARSAMGAGPPCGARNGHELGGTAPRNKPTGRAREGGCRRLRAWRSSSTCCRSPPCRPTRSSTSCRSLPRWRAIARRAAPCPAGRRPSWAWPSVSRRMRARRRQSRQPTGSVAPTSPEPLPAAVLDLDPGGRRSAGDEADLDVGRVAAIAVEMPRVAEARRWLPDGDLAPVVLDAARPTLEDPAAAPALQHDRQVVFRGHGVVLGPPLGDPRRPDVKGVVHRAVDLEGQADRLDHRLRRSTALFAATSRKRAAASPQTRSR